MPIISVETINDTQHKNMQEDDKIDSKTKAGNRELRMKRKKLKIVKLVKQENIVEPLADDTKEMLPQL